jgi:hypothetical protein
LKAVKAAGTDEAKAVISEMKRIPVNDFMTRNGTIRDDGRMMRDMYLLEAKKPSESHSEMGSDENRRNHSGRTGLPPTFGKRMSPDQEVSLGRKASPSFSRPSVSGN